MGQKKVRSTSPASLNIYCPTEVRDQSYLGVRYVNGPPILQFLLFVYSVFCEHLQKSNMNVISINVDAISHLKDLKAFFFKDKISKKVGIFLNNMV